MKYDAQSDIPQELYLYLHFIQEWKNFRFVNFNLARQLKAASNDRLPIGEEILDDIPSQLAAEAFGLSRIARKGIRLEQENETDVGPLLIADL